MPLKRRNGVWYADERGPKGERIRRTSGTRDEAKAREWYAKLLDDLWRQKHLGEKPRRKWDDAVARYMAEKQGTPSWQPNLTKIVTLAPWLEGWYLADIDKELLNQIKLGLNEEKKASTVNRYLSFVSAVLHYACDELEWIDKVPRVKKMEEDARTIEFLTPEEVEALIQQLDENPRSRHLVKFVAFAVATGLRMRNITRLKWSQIDMTQRCMWVNAPDAKSRRSIAVPLAEDAFQVIRSQMGKHQENVFTYRNKPYDKVNPRTLSKHAKAAGIAKHVHPHLFRHTFASWHVMSGTTLLELKELGGWAKLESVLIYAHLSSEHLRKASENRAQIGHTRLKIVEAAKEAG